MEIKSLLNSSYQEAAPLLAKLTQKRLLDYLSAHQHLQTEPLALAASAYFQAGGKGLRPVLLFLAAQAGGPKHSVPFLLQAMAAVECYHTATLVHDDIIDHDTLRRGNYTAHTLVARKYASQLPPQKCQDFGVATAIVGGDLLFAYAADMLAGLDGGFPKQVVKSILDYFAGTLQPGLLLGEQIDVELSLCPLEKATEDQISRMMRLKTGLLLGFAARVGAALGCRTPIPKCPLAGTLGSAAEKAGVAFQLQDDILGLYGDESRLGKPIGSDLREGKVTLLMLRSWNSADAAARKRLQDILGNPNPDDKAIDDARTIVEKTGALQDCRARAETLLAEAHAAFDTVPNEHPRRLLNAWLDTLVKRDK